VAEPLIVLRLTRSQRMALLDIIGDYMRHPEMIEVFIDASRHPQVNTTPEDLLRMVLEAQEEKTE
jgi:hypothetical protein